MSKIGSRKVKGNNVLVDAAEKAKLSIEELIALRTWLAAQLVGNAYAKLGQGGHTQTEVQLRSVFVDLPVVDSAGAEWQSDKRKPFLTTMLAAKPVELKYVGSFLAFGLFPPEEILFDSEYQRNRQLNVLLHADKRSFSATLLIGGPGQGKSTLGQLACQLHRAALLAPLSSELSLTQRELVQSFAQNGRNTQDAAWLALPKVPFLPLQIVLPDFSAWLGKHPISEGNPKIPAILRFLIDLPSAKSVGLRAESLLALAAHIPLLLVLDGFDEVGAAHDRERIVHAGRELLHALARVAATAKIIATTRPQGYGGELAQMGLTLKECYLVPLLEGEALAYAQKLVEAKILDIDARAQTLARLSEAATEVATKRLFTTPLQITIVAALVQHQGRAPKERWNLFLSYFSYIYKREIERNTYASALLAAHRTHIEQVHMRVALLLQVEAERDGGGAARMARARLEQVIAAVLAEDEVEAAESLALVREIATAAEQRLVFLVEPEPGNFGFEIRSLQEFMAAWALTNGRDSDVEARLLQVANASMFRNVALFIASRWFSEGTVLRDVLAERVCAALDNDPEDPLSRISCAGALLALEVLEEGAVLAQPKRARALMAHAVKLLKLPPGAEHLRLLRVANKDTELVLRDAIEQCIGNGQNQQNDCTISAWVCLIVGGNNAVDWAMQLADRFWLEMNAPTILIQACRALRIKLTPWLSKKIEQKTAQILPEDLLQLSLTDSASDTHESVISWVIDVMEFDFSDWNSFRLPNYDIFNCFSLREENKAAPKLIVDSSKLPPHWLAWQAAAQFEVDPGAATLATALDIIADSLPIAKWHALQNQASWPLAACLAKVSLPIELHQIAKMLRTGTLGDIEDWRSAEEMWTVVDKFDFLDDFAAIESVTPWSCERLMRAPPILVFPVRYLDDLPNKQAILTAANALFYKTKKPKLREWAASACIVIMATLGAKAKKLNLKPEDWLKVVPDYIVFFLRKQPSISENQRIALLGMAKKPASCIWHASDLDILKNIISHNALEMHYFSAMLYLQQIHGFAEFDEDNVPEFATRIENVQFSSPEITACVDVLKLYFGVLPGERDSHLIENIRVVATSTPIIWDSLFTALCGNRIPVARINSLLVQLYLELGVSHPLASDIMQQIRKNHQQHQSGLEAKSTWKRLALLEPYPQSTNPHLLEGGLPDTPIVLQSLELNDIGGLHHLSLPLSAPPANMGQWTVILGPNGIGKTTLLRSLALALRDAKNPSIWPKGAFANAWARARPSGEDAPVAPRISVKLADGSEHITTLRENGSITINQTPEHDQPSLFPLFAYGCRRGSALGGSAREVNLSNADGPEIATLFDEGADLIHAETWLIGIDGDAPKNPLSQIIFDVAIAAMKTLLDVASIEVAERRVWITEHGKPRLPFSALSDGYLTSAGWLLDLIARWVEFSLRHHLPVDANFMQTMRGLVLIDEIDLHLHPRWQIDIIARTRRLLPQMSFVVTTHNPLTLVGAKAEEIWILSSANGRVSAAPGVEPPMLLTGGQIYRRYFGIDDIYPDGLGRAMQRFGVLAAYALRNDDEEAEVHALQQQLQAAGLDPEWEIVPREVPQAVPPEALPMVATRKKPARRGKEAK
jgi:energy-coupling factor transporter ATP-binding protein EcfA2